MKPEFSTYNWKHKQLDLQGVSLSGIRTSFALKPYDIGFDVANGLHSFINLKKFFITHGHMDHAGGIPYIISQRALANIAPADFYMPESLVEPLSKICQIWSEIEGHEYRFGFHGVNPSSEIEISQTHYIKPFQTIHRVPSLGYTLFQKSHHLKPEFKNANREAILKLKDKRIEIHQNLVTPIVSFTGDTQIEFLANAEQACRSQVLIMECSYVDDKKDIAAAKKWGHTHLYEIRDSLSLIQSEKIILMHFSGRYGSEYIEDQVKKIIPASELERIVIWKAR